MVRCWRSMCPSDCECKAAILVFFISRKRDSSWKILDSKFLPWSVWTSRGTPCLEIIWFRKVSVIILGLTFFNGKTTHLVKQSTVMNKYLFPAEVIGRGLRASNWILSNEAPSLYIYKKNFPLPLTGGSFLVKQILHILHSSTSCLHVAH